MSSNDQAIRNHINQTRDLIHALTAEVDALEAYLLPEEDQRNQELRDSIPPNPHYRQSQVGIPSKNDTPVTRIQNSGISGISSKYQSDESDDQDPTK